MKGKVNVRGVEKKVGFSATLAAVVFLLVTPSGCRKSASAPAPAGVPASSPATGTGHQHTSWRPTRESIRELNVQLKRSQPAKADEINRWLELLECGNGFCLQEGQMRFAYSTLPPETVSLLPRISDALAGGDSKTRMAILMPLARMGKAAGPAMPGLKACVDDEDKWVSAAAGELIATIERQEPPATQEATNE